MAAEKILVVDDDNNICELLRLYLEKEGYEVTIAHNGADAVKLFQEISPNLMLLDIMLPVQPKSRETIASLRDTLLSS